MPASQSPSTSVDRRPEWTTGALTILVLAVLCPLGLASGEAVDRVAGVFGIRRAFSDRLVAPLGDVFARFFALVPLGEAGIRPHAAAALGGALALALLVARLRLTCAAGPSVAIAAGVALVGLSRPFIEIATVHPGAAIDFAVLAAIAFSVESLRRNPDQPDESSGLGLAFACGLASGGGWSIRAVAWPLGVALTLWALRRGARWPLFAPTVFVAGTGVAFAGVVGASLSNPGTAKMLFHQVVGLPLPGSPSLVTLVASLRVGFGLAADDIGVLAWVVAAIGACVLFVRARGDALILLILWGGAIAAAFATGDILFGRLVLISSLALPVAAAVASMSASFGRAQNPVAVVMALIVVLPAAVLGVGGAFGSTSRNTPHAVARRLDTVFDSPPPSADHEVARWDRYVRAIGLDERRMPVGNDRR